MSPCTLGILHWSAATLWSLLQCDPSGLWLYFAEIRRRQISGDIYPQISPIISTQTFFLCHKCRAGLLQELLFLDGRNTLQKVAAYHEILRSWSSGSSSQIFVWMSEPNPKMQSHLRVNDPRFVNASPIIRLIVSNKQSAMSHNDEYFSPISYRTSPVFAAEEGRYWWPQIYHICRQHHP